jgi:long-chain acyl-CoA synthetase
MRSKTPSVICDAFAGIAARHPTRPAIHLPSEQTHRTLRDVWDDHLAIGRALDALDGPPHGACVSNVGNASAFVPLLLACFSRRRPLVLLDGNASTEGALDVAARFGARFVIEPWADTPFDRTRLPAGLSAVTSAAGDASPIDPRTAVVKMTSGSTSEPRGVMVTEHALAEDGRHIVEAMDIRSADVNLGVIPMAHSYGLGNLVMPLLLRGTSLVLRPQFVGRQVFADIDVFGATVLPGVPFMFDYLVRLEREGSSLSGLRLAITAGARLEPDLARTYADRVGRTIHSFYGTSETGGIAFDADPDPTGPVVVGRPLPGTSVTLRHASGMNHGSGRVYVTGDALGLGYAGAPDDENPAGFIEGGFLTGDIGRFDERQRLVLEGRVSPFVNVAGRKVAPMDVERVIGEVAGVAEVLVLGVPWPARGEAVVACVRRASSAVDATSIRARCLERLPAHEVPRLVLVLDSFPTDARGKIDRPALRRLVADSVTAETGARVLE